MPPTNMNRLQRHSLARPGRRGGALVASLIVVTVIAGLGAGLVSVQASITRRHAQGIDQKRALYIAEAGLSEAFSAVTVGKSGTIGSPELPAEWGSGVYWVEADPDEEGNIHLKSVGLCGRGRFALNAVVKPASNPIAVHGIHGRRGLTVGVGSQIDGFDSTEGDYESRVDRSLPSTTTGYGARLTTNGDVTVRGEPKGRRRNAAPQTLVYGDVRPGSNGVVVSEPGARITGSTLPLEERIKAIRIPVPDISTSQGSATLSGVLTGGHLRYESIRVRGDSTLILRGPLTLVLNELDVSGRLELDGSDGKIEVFVLHAFKMRNGSQLETTSPSPRAVGIFLGALGNQRSRWSNIASSRTTSRSWKGEGAEEVEAAPATTSQGRPLILLAKGTFRGLLYAPFNNLKIPASLRVIGAVGARKVELAPGAQVTFDEGLVTASLGVTVLPELLSWQIVDLPDEAIVTSRTDPVQHLKRRGVKPLKSSKAHREAQASLNYIDSKGRERQFVGDLDSFDWSELDSLGGVRWRDPTTGSYRESQVPVGTRMTGARGFISITPTDE